MLSSRVAGLGKASTRTRVHRIYARHGETTATGEPESDRRRRHHYYCQPEDPGRLIDVRIMNELEGLRAQRLFYSTFIIQRYELILQTQGEIIAMLESL